MSRTLDGSFKVWNDTLILESFIGYKSQVYSGGKRGGFKFSKCVWVSGCVSRCRYVSECVCKCVYVCLYVYV